MSFCRPDIKHKDVCYSTKTLKKFVNKVIKRHDLSKRSEYIDVIKKYMKGKKETDWDKVSIIFRQDKVHKPDALWTKKNLGICNINIEETIKQYKGITYLGYISIDDNNILKLIKSPGKFKFLLVNYWGKKNKLYKHWACIVLSYPNILFFESTADRTLLHHTLPIIKDIIKTRKYKYFIWNRVKVQYDENNCGIFCVDFAVSMYKKISYKSYLNNLIKTKESLGIEKYITWSTNLRKKYFIVFF